jgi:small basic protein
LIAVPFIALIIGALLAFGLHIQPLHGIEGQYLAVACLAGLDTVLGGIRGGLEDRFDNAIFVSGFLSNICIAFLLAYLGDKIYLPLYLVVAFVFGVRIFNNLSLIRRSIVTIAKDSLARRKRQAALAPTPTPETTP